MPRFFSVLFKVAEFDFDFRSPPRPSPCSRRTHKQESARLSASYIRQERGYDPILDPQASLGNLSTPSLQRCTAKGAPDNHLSRRVSQTFGAEVGKSHRLSQRHWRHDTTARSQRR